MKIKDLRLKKFNEAILRSTLIRKEIINTIVDPEDEQSFNKLEDLKDVYIQTIRQLIYNGREYIQLSTDEDEQIRTAIDLDKYESILRRIN